jgi:hypothetical protein
MTRLADYARKYQDIRFERRDDGPMIREVT